MMVSPEPDSKDPTPARRLIGRCIGCFHPFETGPCGGCGAIEQCDGSCHDEGTGDCRRCESGDYYQACDDCRFYMAQNV